MHAMQKHTHTHTPGKDEQLVTSLFERVTPGVVSIAKEAPPEARNPVAKLRHPS